jgi:invasion protein IalB
MDYRNASARPFGRALTATVAAIGLAFIVAPGALAQQPVAKPAPKTQAKPAAPAPAPQPPQQQAATPEQPQLMYSPWMKVCGKGNEPNGQEVCTTAKDGRLENGMPVAVVQLVEPKGDTRKLLRVIVPLGMQLHPGTRVLIDQNQPLQAPYSICFPVGCMADYEVNADTVAQMKKGQMLTVQAINMQGSAISLPLPLTDFAKAYDGPPTDPKVFEEQQRKLQDELQKKAEEARKKLESQNQQPPAQAPAAAPPPTAQKK